MPCLFEESRDLGRGSRREAASRCWSYLPARAPVQRRLRIRARRGHPRVPGTHPIGVDGDSLLGHEPRVPRRLPDTAVAGSMQGGSPAIAGDPPHKRLMGFEPTTFCMASRRSSQLSYSRVCAEVYRWATRCSRSPHSIIRSCRPRWPAAPRRSSSPPRRARRAAWDSSPAAIAPPPIWAGRSRACARRLAGRSGSTSSRRPGRRRTPLSSPPTPRPCATRASSAHRGTTTTATRRRSP